MGVGNLKRPSQPTPEERERQRQEFIAGAALQATTQEEEKPAPKAATKAASKKAKAVRTIFSLTDEVNRQIDKLSLAPRHFKASRSDVVKAGVLALRAMSKAEQVALLAQAVGASATDDSEDESE